MSEKYLYRYSGGGRPKSEAEGEATMAAWPRPARLPKAIPISRRAAASKFSS
jgi:hypothetical protein